MHMCIAFVGIVACASEPSSSAVQSLEGPWLLATEPRTSGATSSGSKRRNQALWPRGCHGSFRTPFLLSWRGVVLREFVLAANPLADVASYSASGGGLSAEVWLNGIRVGGHEGPKPRLNSMSPTPSKPGGTNLLAVRVLNPSTDRGRRHGAAEIPHRNKAVPYTAGSSYNHGGIVDSWSCW